MHHGKNVAVRFYPRLSSSPTGRDYVAYCKSALARYVPWIDAMENSWGGANATDDEIKTRWEDFLAGLAAQEEAILNGEERLPDHRVLPDVLTKLVDEYRRDHVTGPDDLGENMPYPTLDGAGEPVAPEPPTDDNNRDDYDDFDIGEICDGQHEGMTEQEVLRRAAADEDDESIEHDTTNCHQLVQRYARTPLSSLLEKAKQILKENNDNRVRPVVHSHLLNEQQRRAHDAIVRSATRESQGADRVSSTDGGPDISRLMILRGVGGTGKSFTINAVLSTLERDHGFSKDNYLVLATTGKAATVIQGATVHSARHGLAIPVGKPSLRGNRGETLSGTAATALQKRLKNVKLVFLDEFSMLKPSDLYYMHRRLQQGRTDYGDALFGGATVVLCGDLGQLPPVLTSKNWWDVMNANNRQDEGHYFDGLQLYREFKTGLKLTEVRRLQQDDPDAQYFHDFLMRLRDGECTEDDWNVIKEKCVQDVMGKPEWENRQFASDDAVHLYCTNKKVNRRNRVRLRSLHTPVRRICASHSHARAKELSHEKFRGLRNEIYLAVGARVMLTSNVCQTHGLANGAIGTVKEIVYESETAAPSLPSFVIVDFGAAYTGDSFFPDEPNRRGWVPIEPMSASKSAINSDGDFFDMTRTMLPLQLAWAFTVWKAQGQTFLCEIVIDMDDDEKEHGLSYVAFSRATTLKSIGILGGLSKQRLCDRIAARKSIGKRKREEYRLDAICETTEQKLQELLE